MIDLQTLVLQRNNYANDKISTEYELNERDHSEKEEKLAKISRNSMENDKIWEEKVESEKNCGLNSQNSTVVHTTCTSKCAAGRACIASPVHFWRLFEWNSSQKIGFSTKNARKFL